MHEFVNTAVRPMNGKEFRAWLERAGILVGTVRRSPRGSIRAFLASYVGRHKAHIAELSKDGKRIYLRKVNDKGREILCDTWEA